MQDGGVPVSPAQEELIRLIQARPEDNSREAIVQGGLGLLMLLGSLFFAAGALAAPDEVALGKAEGYPICPPSLRPDTRCLVGLVSHFDEVFPAPPIMMTSLKARTTSH